MTIVEDMACKALLAPKKVASPATGKEPPKKKKKKYAELFSQSRERRQSSSSTLHSKYSSAKHSVLASASEAERVWSMADCLYANKRRSAMSPVLFECIMFLKYNQRLWGLADVVEANKRRINNSDVSKEKRLALLERIKPLKESLADWETFHNALADVAEESDDCVEGEVNGEANDEDGEEAEM